MTASIAGEISVTESLETIVGRLDERVENNAKNMEKGFKSLSDQFDSLRMELKRDLADSQRRFDEDHQRKCPGRKAMRILRKEQRAQETTASVIPVQSAPAPASEPVNWGSVKIVVGSLIGLGMVVGAAYKEYSKDSEPRPAIVAPVQGLSGGGVK